MGINRERLEGLAEARLDPKIDKHLTELTSLLRVIEDELRSGNQVAAQATVSKAAYVLKALQKSIPSK